MSPQRISGPASPELQAPSTAASAPLWLGAPSIAQAEKQRLRLIKRLRRFAEGFDGVAELCERLSGCKKGKHCRNSGCPTCLTVAQRLAVRKLSAESRQHGGARPNHLVALSIMSPAWQAAVGCLHQLNPIKVKNELNQALSRAGHLHWLWVGLDISLNDDRQKGHGIYWQAQAYGFALVDDRQAFANALRTQFSASANISRPVRIVKCDGTHHAFSYAFKTNFVRRIAYPGNGFDRHGHIRRCWRTRKVSLRATEEVELRVWLHRIGLTGRVLSDISHFKQKK